jgi:hypothetical protein
MFVYKVIKITRKYRDVGQLNCPVDSPCPKLIHPMPEGMGFLD